MMHCPAIALTFALVLLTSTVGAPVTRAEMQAQMGGAYSRQVGTTAAVTSKPVSAVAGKVKHYGNCMLVTNRHDAGMVPTNASIEKYFREMADPWLDRGKSHKLIEIIDFITSLKANVKTCVHAVRSHWHIENKLRHVLDVVFGKDYS